MKVIPVFLIFCIYSAKARVIFSDADSEEVAPVNYNSGNKLILPSSSDEETLSLSPVSTVTPNFQKTSIFPTDSEDEIPASTGKTQYNNDPTIGNSTVVPAGLNDTQGRTFHHLVALSHKVENKFNHLLYKIVSPFLPPPPPGPEPHYIGLKFSSLPDWLNPYPYNYRTEGPAGYGSEKYGNYYNDDDDDQYSQSSDISNGKYTVIKPSQAKPEFTPLNLKERVEKFVRHTIGKRSVPQTEYYQPEQNIQDDGFPSGRTRDGRTLYKIIPNFEENFGKLMRRLVGPLYGSRPIANINEIYKSDQPSNTNTNSNSRPGPVIRFTNLASLWPRVVQRMSEMTRLRQLFTGTPVQKS